MRRRIFQLASGIQLTFIIYNLAFSGTLVYQSGDTLKFMAGDSLVSTLIMSTDTHPGPAARIATTRAHVSPDHRQYLINEETYYVDNDSIISSLTIYSSDHKLLWQRSYNNDRRISFELSNFFNDFLALVSTTKFNEEPRLELVKDGKSRTVIKEREWQRINEYSISSNERYIALHVKNPYQGRSWDYVHFIDLKTKKSWSYVFPMCVSCKRNRLELIVSDDGTTEVIYKSEHRLFARDGTLTDVYMKLE